MERIFIAFEGPDCVGKSTQVHEIENRLKETKYKVSSYKIPYKTDSLSFRIISEMIKTEEVLHYPLLFQAAMIENRFEFQSSVLDHSKEDIILVDRWNLSTCFYGEAQGIPSETTKTLMKGLREPDVYIIFNGAPFDRESKDVLDQNMEIQTCIREKYRSYQEKNCIYVNANQERFKVTDKIWAELSSFFPCNLSIVKN